MLLRNDFKEYFGNTPVFGMIHLAGGGNKFNRAVRELEIYESFGVDCAIVEDYHASASDVKEALTLLSGYDFSVKIGVNLLSNYRLAFKCAEEFDLSFIQMDVIAGKYLEGKMDIDSYKSLKTDNVFVLGGVWPKYYHPITTSKLEEDLKNGMNRCEAVVVTGEGTGVETSLSKIKLFRKYLKNYPLIIGAGLNADNAFEQLLISDGCIIGSYFKKDNNTNKKILPENVKKFMNVVFKVREEKNKV